MLVDVSQNHFTLEVDVTPAGWHRKGPTKAGRVAAVVSAIAEDSSIVSVEADELAVRVKVPVEPGDDLDVMQERLLGVAADAYAAWLAEGEFLAEVRRLLSGSGGGQTDEDRVGRLRDLVRVPNGIPAEATARQG